MQDLVKRYFWLVGATVVMVCVVFAAKATNNIVVATLLNDSDHGPRIQPIAPPTPTVKPTRTKDGTQLATRDMFCSECTPSVDTTKPLDANQTAITTLPLILLATNVGVTDKDSYATLINTADQHQGSYSLGDRIPGASGKLRLVHYKYIEFENNGHIERLVLPGQQAPITPTVAETKPVEGDDIEALAENGIRKIDDNNYEIDRKLIDQVLANPMGLGKQARIVPSVKDGKPDGFKLYAIRPNSAIAKLGLTNGDTLEAINNFQLTSVDKALEAYTKLKDSTTLELEVVRRGKQMNLKYVIK
jgi:general secretion pathway protein C